MEIRVAKKEENKEVIKFLNKVFHKPFPRLIPSLYGKEKNLMDYHYVVREAGELIGAICAYPEDIIADGITINGVAIGMVATKKTSRGKGVMTTMLNHSFNEYKDKADVMFLTGRRHRYEHFGYYPAGACYSFQISSMSIKKWEKGCPYSIVKAETEEDFEAVDSMAKGARVVIKRPLARECETLRNWFSKLYLIKKEEEVVGFASGKLFKGHTLERIHLKNGSVEDYIKAVSSYKNFKKAPVLNVDVLPTECTLKKAMHACSEDYSVSSHEKYKVISYARLIEKLLLISTSENELENYNKVIEILGREKLRVSVINNKVTVAKSDESPDVVLTEEEAICSLLGQEESIVPGMVKIALRHSDFI